MANPEFNPKEENQPIQEQPVDTVNEPAGTAEDDKLEKERLEGLLVDAKKELDGIMEKAEDKAEKVRLDGLLVEARKELDEIMARAEEKARSHSEKDVDADLAKNLGILERRREAFEKESKRLKEILKTRPLTDGERANFGRLAKMGPSPEENK